ncbi:unnamed protein product [Parnassius apollo]|uniref:(apollo) hypothetical protein n=1 Tax=Parnassius apollo TaxID=110799 RepID=A0A8S3WQD1_PARAO|nr:unnamed protein product [Parnassius apollo]
MVQKSLSSDDIDLEIDYAESGNSEWNEDSDSIVENTEVENEKVTEKRRLKLAFYKRSQKRVKDLFRTPDRILKICL